MGPSGDSRRFRAPRPTAAARVIVTMSPEGTGGGQHHQVSAVLATDAFRAAADPAQFPEQIRDGLRPWQALKLYRPAGGRGGRGGRGGPPGAGPGLGLAAGSAAAGNRPRRHRTARSQRSTPTSTSPCSVARLEKWEASPRACTCARAACRWLPRPVRRRVVPPVRDDGSEGAGTAETSLFDGIDVSLGALARYAGERPPQPLVTALGTIAARVDAASRALETRGPSATVPISWRP